jgi:hypothetical protein
MHFAASPVSDAFRPGKRTGSEAPGAGHLVPRTFRMATGVMPRRSLSRVDGFDQDECTSERDEGAIVLRRLLATQRDALESFEFADCLLDAGAALVENLWKKDGLVFDVGRYGITGHIPRWRAASRFDLES